MSSSSVVEKRRKEAMYKFLEAFWETTTLICRRSKVTLELTEERSEAIYSYSRTKAKKPVYKRVILELKRSRRVLEPLQDPSQVEGRSKPGC